MTVIAMTREMGSLGKDVARGVAERLKLDLLHNEVVEHHIAERLHLGESLVHRYLEGESSLTERLRIDKQAVAFCTAEEIFELAEAGNVLIRGWGATALLRPVSHVICLRVCAPLGLRVEVMMRRLDSEDKRHLTREISHNDAAHRRVARRFSVSNWEDPSLYDLVLNTQRLSVERCIDLVYELAQDRAFRQTSGSRAMLAYLKQQAGDYRQLKEALKRPTPEDALVVGSRPSRTGPAPHVPEDYATSREDRDLLW